MTRLHRPFFSIAANTALAIVLAACSGGDATRVHVEVAADSSWGLDHYQLEVGTFGALAEPLPALDVQVPDDLTGRVQTIEVWGLVAGDQVAYGSVTVTPVLHATVPATVVLAALSCGLWCTDGDVECGSDDMSTTTCMQQSDGCLAWSQPTACPADAPYCSNGTCAAQCSDECTEGETECDTAFAVRTCEQSAGDSCWHWSTPTACGSAQTCTNGTCGTATTCSQDGATCSDGDPCTVDDTCEGGVCSGAPTCTAAPANATPTCAADGTCGFACDAGYMPSGSSCVVMVCPSGSATFMFTGAPQQFTPPACVTSITVDVRGAGGGGVVDAGGPGGRTQATLTITSSDVLNIYVGGAGGPGNGSAGAGGYNGGGAGGGYPADEAYGGGGGGASDIRIGGTDLSHRVVIGGGGGGAPDCNLAGGVGGGLVGGGGPGCDGVETLATGGTQTAGGSGGTYSGFSPGAAGQAGLGGAAGAGSYGGGGGGGLFGGGGGASAGGGGGAGFASAAATGVTMTSGYQTGNGVVIVTY